MAIKPEKKSIKEWAEDDRPREKMITKGKGVLSNAELIAILIGSGSSKQSAVELAREILDSVDNSLISLSNLSIDDLTTHNGIGEAKAISIVAAMELGRRRRGAEAPARQVIKSSTQSFEYLAPYIEDPRREQFIVLYLNQANNPIKVERISDGGITFTVADPRDLFKRAIMNNATGVVLCHNHPSGNPIPSDKDKALTKRLVAAGDILGISVIDHIIIGEERFYSFLDDCELR